jgi:hypothetical protein
LPRRTRSPRDAAPIWIAPGGATEAILTDETRVAITEAVAEMTAQFAGIAALLPLAEARAATWDGTGRLLVLESTFRFAAACQWFHPGGGSSMRFQDPVGMPAPVFELAVPELEGGPGAGRG